MPIATTWRDPSPVDVPVDVLDLAGHRLAGELLVRRGLGSRDAALAFLDPWHRGPSTLRDLPGVDAAVARLRRAVERRERVLVWGDFDVDGQTATAILVLSLRRLGLDPAWHVPKRATDSHGLNDGCVAHAARVGATVLVTCDCGVNDDGQVVALAAAGLDTIVTDHHAMPARLRGQPHPSHALVWPGALADGHRARRLSGAGVAYFVAAELLASFGESGEDLLDLVALGTIADVAPLVAENRYLAQMGLPSLNRGRRPGIKALLTLANRLGAAPQDAGAAGWIIAPPLNAFGRLGQAQPAVELLMSQDEAAVMPIAVDAHALNRSRQGLCDQIVEVATDVVEACIDGRDSPTLGGPCRVTDSVIFAADPDWHLGVIGLAAGRLAGVYLRPAVLATRDAAGLARVSMRSAPWCDLNDVVGKLTADPSLGFRGGSHSAAAGGSLPWDNLEAFGAAIDSAAAEQRPGGSLTRELKPDAELRLADATLDACRAVGRLAPFGHGNPTPLFLVRQVRVVEAPRQIGKTQRHLRLRVADAAGRYGSVLWWDGATRSLPAGSVDLCVAIEANEFNGHSEARLVVQAVRPTTPP